jgi:GR25 family glycosyltransferase involved in LPS biosynthesis
MATDPPSARPQESATDIGFSILINLDRRGDRLAAFQAQYLASDLHPRVPLVRLSAVDAARDISPAEHVTPEAASELADVALTKRRKYHGQLTAGGVGCYLSHMAAWRMVVNLGVPCLVFEDDVKVPPRVLERVLEAVRAARAKYATEVASWPSGTLLPPWMLELAAFACHRQCERDDAGITQPGLFWGLGAAVVTPPAARWLLQHATEPLLPIDMQIDAKLSEMQQRGAMVIYAARVFSVGAFGTDIQTNMLPSHMKAFTREDAEAITAITGRSGTRGCTVQ